MGLALSQITSFRSLAVTCLLLAMWAPSPAGAQVTEFAFTSSPGSWVGHGYLNYYVSPATNWTFSASTNSAHTYVGLHARSLDPSAPTSNYYWDLDLESAFDQPLLPGLYENCYRYPFNPTSQPGMWLSGNHRGDNQITGYFRVLEAEYSGSTVVRFAVEFKQYDEGVLSNWVDGRFFYNSTIPEPVAVSSLGSALALCALRRPASRRRG